MKHKKFKTRPRSGGDTELNITAMADIFTVLLVFLLMGYASGAVDIVPSAGLRLPEAFAQAANSDALKVEISENAIVVDSVPVATLDHYKVASTDKAGDGTISKLSDSLKKARDRQVAIAGMNTDVKLDSRIILIADSRVPYSTVRSVLQSAAVHGYVDFKLAVVTSGGQ